MADCDSGAGAQNIDQIDLSGLGGQYTATLLELDIDGNLGQAGPNPAIKADQFGETGSETIHVTGDVLNNIEVSGDVLADIDVTGNIAGNITIGGLLAGDLSCATAQDITLNGEGAHTGDITIGGVYENSLECQLRCARLLVAGRVPIGPPVGQVAEDA
ncbi:MAG: hypothetical protein KKB50_06145 [Planctomycetes bacterium]|nr:hypothetical protein [Planctomycetota bacterium]